MIQKMSHTSILVDDQDKALDFYVGMLGMEVRTDQTMPDGFRWLTVAPKGQDLEIILMKLGPTPIGRRRRNDARPDETRRIWRRRSRH